MRRIALRAWLPPVLVLLFLFGAHSPAGATVRFKGQIKVWNTITNRYDPLYRCRVRVVLAEDYDWDTSDIEAMTDDHGRYSCTKTNAWWRDGYDYYIAVIAECGGKLEVQSLPIQLDGWQARSYAGYASDDSTKEHDIFIGGPPAGDARRKDNIKEYVSGGVACIGAVYDEPRSQGERAFFIYNETMDHRRQLMETALTMLSWEEKEVSFPADITDLGMYGPWDTIHISDNYWTDTSEPVERRSLVCRHEMSHAIMADEYFLAWPGLLNGIPGGHNIYGEAEEVEWAWNEAWAEFLAEVTQKPKYGMSNDLETLQAEWLDDITTTLDHCWVEGEVASALWDIYDPVGWEERAEQVDEIPGVEEFYDGLTDPMLAAIWLIMSRRHCSCFTIGWIGSQSDSFVHYWLNDFELGMEHELKSILYNRRIRDVDDLTETAPEITIGDVSVEGYTATIPVLVKEADKEDREHVWIELYVRDDKMQSVNLDENWNGDQFIHVFEQPVASTTFDPVEITVAVHDHMEADFDTVEVTPDEVIVGLKIEAIGFIATRQVTGNVPLDDFEPPDARDIYVEVEYRDSTTVGTDETHLVRMPEGGNVILSGMEDYFVVGSHQEVYQVTDLDQFEIQVDLRAFVTEWGQPHQEGMALTLREGNNFWIGMEPRRVMEAVWRQEVEDSFIEHRVDIDVTIRIDPIFEIAPILQLAPVQAVAIVEGSQPRAALRLGTDHGEIVGPTTLQPGTATTVGPGTTIGQALLSGAALFDRAGALIDEVSRLEADALQVAEELEYKLSHPAPPGGDQPPPGPVGLGLDEDDGGGAGGGDTGPAQRTLRGRYPMGATHIGAPKLLVDDLVSPGAVLAVPPQAAVLEDVVAGRLAVLVEEAARRDQLEELKTQLESMEARLQERSEQLTLTRSALQQRAGHVNALVGLSTQQVQWHADRLQSRLARMDEAQVATPDYSQLIQLEIQAIDAALAGVQPTEEGGDEPGITRPGGGRTPRDPRDRPPTTTTQPDDRADPRRGDRGAVDSGWDLSGGAQFSQARGMGVFTFDGSGEAVSKHPDFFNLRVFTDYRAGGGTGYISLCRQGGPKGKTEYRIKLSGGGVSVVRLDGGGETVLATGGAGLGKDWTEIKVDVQRGRIRVFAEGKEVLAAEDPNAYLRSGYVAIGCEGAGGVGFRDFRTIRL